MSKSLNNSIFLSASKKVVDNKIKRAVTDTNRTSLKDKGNPEVCTIFEYHRVFNKGECNNIAEMCRNATIGCVSCKKTLSNSLNNILTRIRERRKYYEDNLNQVKDILYTGTQKVKKVAEETLNDVKDAMNINYF